MLYLIYCTCGLWFPLVEYKSSVLVQVCVLSEFYISVFYLSIKVFVCCKLLQVNTGRSGPLHLVAAVGSTARQSAAGPTGIHCPPVGGRAHRDPLPASRRQGPRARCSRAKEREGARRAVRERRSTTRKSAAGPHVVDRTKQRSSG